MSKTIHFPNTKPIVKCSQKEPITLLQVQKKVLAQSEKKYNEFGYSTTNLSKLRTSKN